VNHWILGSFLKDFLAFYGFAFIAIAYFTLTSPNHNTFAIIFFLLPSLIDTGHVYLSFLRVIWKPLKEKRLYLLMFILIFSASFLWMIFKAPGFWSILLYFTIYHHLKQYYGITRWYQKKNNRFCQVSNIFLYTLTLLPVVAFHFRNISISIYSKEDIFLYPSTYLYTAIKNLYLLFLFLYLFFEIYIFLRSSNEIKNSLKIEVNRISSILFPALLHGICFIKGESISTIIFPLLITHGLSYFWIIALNIKKNSPIKAFQTWKIALFASCLIMLIGGGLESLLNLAVNDYDYLSKNSDLLTCILLALIVTPNLWHYIVDGIVWKSKDSEAAILYSKN
jgi:hypothetical protein